MEESLIYDNLPGQTINNNDLKRTSLRMWIPLNSKHGIDLEFWIIDIVWFDENAFETEVGIRDPWNDMFFSV